MNPTLPAELRTPQGDLLARGSLHRLPDGALEFLPTTPNNRLVGYFFGVGDLVRLHTSGSRPLRVRLSTRWVAGSRKWSLQPSAAAATADTEQRRQSA